MPLPKFSDLSPTVQTVVIVAVGVALWGVTEYMVLRPVIASNEAKQTQATTLENEIAPWRPYRERVSALKADNEQLERQLANLRQLVPDESAVDDFIRDLQARAATSGVAVRRFTAKPPVTQQYHVEVPFEMELDGAYYDVLQFYDSLRGENMERITNVSDLRMNGIQTGTGSTVGRYKYSPNETVTVVCTVVTFFSREEGPTPEESTPAR